MTRKAPIEATARIPYSFLTWKILRRPRASRPVPRLAERPFLAQAPQTGIQNLAQPFADQIVSEDSDKNRRAGKDRQPPRKRRAAGFMQERAPGNQLSRHAN